MYKLLLCWRYLCTRWVALASIISVWLGVTVMIAVNSVMGGFATEMRNRIHGILSDVVFESRSLEGFRDPDWHMAQIRQVLGDGVEGMTPTVTVPAMLSFQVRGQWITQQVQMIGIDEHTQGAVSDFSKYLQHPANRRQLSFDLRESGYDRFDHQIPNPTRERKQMRDAGWTHRREMAAQEEFLKPRAVPLAVGPPSSGPVNPFDAPGAPPPAQDNFDPAKEQHTGLVLGIALSCHRDKDGEDHFLIAPGDDVKLTFPTAGTPPKAISDSFTIVDFYESKMSESDGSFVFVPLRKLQELRGMFDPSSGVGFATSIQIKLKPGVDLNAARDKLRQAFQPALYVVSTWRDKRAPILDAVQTETAILNVLLFMIIAVAGFGILAVFFMIVVEKTRDIGVLKSLGASGSGIMGIFLAYGLALGLVGAGAGMATGLFVVSHINQLATGLAKLTGQEVFPPDIYYFYSIPTIVSPTMVASVVAGAVGIAVLASILPALRAALLHPVEALRYE